ncbi:AAA family ATPase [Candidatus Woesearchaeota archaeon]|nr:MAG: AAA family ATPase [Candidatus Woesearchaeota archaeon]
MKEDNKKDHKETVTVTVAEAIQPDVGRGIARVPTSILEKLNLEAGDTIEIIGKRKAVASVRRARPEDEGMDIIRIDGTIRFNASTSVGENVEIKKAECMPAESVTLSPVEAVQFSGDPTNYFHQNLLDKPLIKGQKVTIDVMGTHLHYVVTKVVPNTCVKVVPSTKLVVSDKVVKAEELRIPEIIYEDIGGLKNEIDMIREMVEIPMKHPEVFQRLGISAPKGVLLTGPPGTGKTLLARAVASETESQFYAINGPEIMSKYYGESEKHLRDIFEEAEKNAPSVIFIDEIDSIAPKRGEGRDQTEKRVVAQLLTLMDGLKSRGNVVVIAATNRPDDIDEALRRPGRFDREIKIMPPNREGRKEILQIHTRGMPLAKDVDLDKIAEKTVGFTGADIEVLCKEAAMKALKPYVPSLKQYNIKVPTPVLEKIEVTMKHFEEALQMVEPSALREVMITKPNVRWSDIGGLEEAKKKLREAIELPLQKPELFKKAGIRPPKGVLLYGPPGTGKTLLAKAVATEANANFISVKGPELVSKWVGESEKKIREIFKRARLTAPSVIFFDEFDSITKVRGASLTDSTERMVNQLLTELDGIESLEKVTVIAATNRPDLIDPALLRPGRIELKIEISLPDEESRKQIFEVHTRGMPLAKDVRIEEFVKRTEGWTGAEIENLCREAGMNAIRDASSRNTDEVEITMKHFEEAFKEVENNRQPVKSAKSG